MSIKRSLKRYLINGARHKAWGQGIRRASMYRIKSVSLCFICFLVFFVMGCSKERAEKVVEIKHYSVDNMDGLIHKTDVEIDKQISSDGNGSLKITTEKPSVIPLYETGNIDIKHPRLIYQAKVRTEAVEGPVFIEMWCHFAGQGEFFSRAIQSSLTGTNEWTSQETPFLLDSGQNPDNVRLNIVINGKGTVWIDDIHLLKSF